MNKTFELHPQKDWYGRYGSQKFYVLLIMPESGRADTYDFDIGAARCTGGPKFLCDTIRDVPRNIDAITASVKKALGVEK